MSIMECVVSNVAIATVLALVAALVGRVTAKPQVTHALWVLVLVKLVTPPLVHIPVSYPFSKAIALESSVDSADATNDEAIEEIGIHSAGATDVLSSSVSFQDAGRDGSVPTTASHPSWPQAFVYAWVAGSLMWFVLATTRLIRFKTLLRYACPTSGDIQMEVSTIAARYGLRSLPRVLVVDAKIPPLIWGFCGRSSMVLPSGLLNRLGTEERAGLLAHELAHLRRYDHWIRWLEFVILGIYWWNPVAWWARTQIQQAEEDCCDGWVLWAFPGKASLYAQTLVDTVEFLADSPGLKPDIATAFNEGHALKRRIEMILRNNISRRLPWRMRIPLVLFALVIAPLSLLAQSEGTDKKEELSRSVAAQRLFLARDGVRSNLQRIRTWQGEYRFIDSLVVPDLRIGAERTSVGPFRQVRVGVLRFSIDNTSDSIRCIYELTEPTRYTHLDDSPIKDVPAFPPFEIQNVLTPDSWVELAANRSTGLPVGFQDVQDSVQTGRIIKRREPSASSNNGRWSTFPDPRQLFAGNMTPLSVDTVLESLAVAANDSARDFPIVVTLDGNGDLITVHTFDANPFSAAPTLTTRYSKSNGYNVTEVTGEGEPNNSSCTAKCAYELVDGVWLPQKYNLTQRDSEGRILNRRIFERNSVALNKPLDPNTFTIKN